MALVFRRASQVWVLYVTHCRICSWLPEPVSQRIWPHSHSVANCFPRGVAYCIVVFSQLSRRQLFAPNGLPEPIFFSSAAVLQRRLMPSGPRRWRCCAAMQNLPTDCIVSYRVLCYVSAFKWVTHSSIILCTSHPEVSSGGPGTDSCCEVSTMHYPNITVRKSLLHRACHSLCVLLALGVNGAKTINPKPETLNPTEPRFSWN